MLMLLRAGVSTSNGVRRNLWRGLTSHLQRRTLATVEEPVFSGWKPEESQTNSDDASEKPEASFSFGKDFTSPIFSAKTITSSEANCSKPAFGPFGPYCHPGTSHKLAWDSWRRALEYSPERNQLFKDVGYWRNENLVVVYDNYPKAKIHLVVLTKRFRVGDLSDLSREHLPYVEEMTTLAESIISSLSENEELAKVGFQYGFHAFTSMSQLALHIVSRDFISDHMQRKKQWNSFNTGFFIPARVIIETIERYGPLPKVSKRERMLVLKDDMYCRRCKTLLEDMQEVRDHVVRCDVKSRPLV